MTNETLTLGKHFLTIDSTINFTLYNPVTQESITKSKGKWTIDCYKLLPEKYFKNNPQFVLELVYDETSMSADDFITWNVTDIDIGSIQSENENVQIINADALDVNVTNDKKHAVPVTNETDNNNRSIPLEVYSNIKAKSFLGGVKYLGYDIAKNYELSDIIDTMATSLFLADSYIFITFVKSGTTIKLNLHLLTDCRFEIRSSGEVRLFGIFEIINNGNSSNNFKENSNKLFFDSETVEYDYWNSSNVVTTRTYDNITDFEFSFYGRYF